MPADGESTVASSSSSPSTATPSSTSPAGSARSSAGPTRSGTIHGGVRRSERRRITEEFTHNRDCHVLLATDAAGEGLNLQAAHLMVNYDLPWNPNRIEQRFGRIHRIGQTRGLPSLEPRCQRHPRGRRLHPPARQDRGAAQGLRRQGLRRSRRRLRRDDPCATCCSRRSATASSPRCGRSMETGHRRKRLGRHSTSCSTSAHSRREVCRRPTSRSCARQMDEARARRLQPHYIERAFARPSSDSVAECPPRERGRFEITNVPAHPAPVAPAPDRHPLRPRHLRDRARTRRRARAELLAPGPPAARRASSTRPSSSSAPRARARHRARLGQR